MTHVGLTVCHTPEPHTRVSDARELASPCTTYVQRF